MYNSETARNRNIQQLEKQSITMADDTKTLYHGMELFTNKRLTWGKDVLKRKCRLTPKVTTGNVCSFETKLLVLEGNKKPELFIL